MIQVVINGAFGNLWIYEMCHPKKDPILAVILGSLGYLQVKESVLNDD